MSKPQHPGHTVAPRRDTREALGKPEDLHGAAIFLASAASDFIAGSSIVIDGGYSIRA
jgi:NAD(P)-dependent dehydrogenase (short-subunit alcohol dehydrogenase family)